MNINPEPAPLIMTNPYFRERILIFGPPKAGKTSDLFSIVATSALSWRAAGRAHEQPLFRLIDNDQSAGRLLTSGRFAPLKLLREQRYPQPTQREQQLANPEGNVVLYRVSTWEEHKWALLDAIQAARYDDWIAVDLIGKPWESVRAYFVQTVHGQDVGAFMLQKRVEEQRRVEAEQKKPSRGSQLDGDTDWGPINAEYKSWADKLFNSERCHVLVIAAEDEIGRRESQEVSSLFGGFGVKPVGQKALGYQVRTLVRRTSDWQGRYIECVGDTERPVFQRIQCPDFAWQYLANTGDWEGPWGRPVPF